MITLKNLIVKNNILSCSYYRENETEDMGRIVFNLEKKELVEYDLSEYDKSYINNPSLGKSIRAIETLIKYNKFPETYHYIWY